jgi:hypothetical protein
LKNSPLESSEQKGFIDWLRNKYPHLISYSIANGATMTKREAAKMKNEGMLEGVLDICVILPKGKSVYIEMKRIRPKGRLSDVQKDFINKANGLGHDTIVAWGAEDASIKFLKYLDDNF